MTMNMGRIQVRIRVSLRHFADLVTERFSYVCIKS